MSEYDDAVYMARLAVRARAAKWIAEVVDAATPLTKDEIEHMRRLMPPPTPEQVAAVFGRPDDDVTEPPAQCRVRLTDGRTVG